MHPVAAKVGMAGGLMLGNLRPVDEGKCVGVGLFVNWWLQRRWRAWMQGEGLCCHL